MKSIIYIGMDVHKKTYSLCALLKETGEIIGETKIPADVSLIIKFIENTKKSVDSDDVQIKTSILLFFWFILLFISMVVSLSIVLISVPFLRKYLIAKDS